MKQLWKVILVMPLAVILPVSAMASCHANGNVS